MRAPITETHGRYASSFRSLRAATFWLQDKGFAYGDDAPLTKELVDVLGATPAIYSMAILAWRRCMGVEFQNQWPYCFAAWDLSLGKKRTPTNSLNLSATLDIISREVEQEEQVLGAFADGSVATPASFSDLFSAAKTLECTFHFSHESWQMGDVVVIEPVFGVRINHQRGDIIKSTPALLMKEIISIRSGIECMHNG